LLAQPIQDQEVEGVEQPGGRPFVSRRQQVAGEPHPSSRVGNSRHGVEVRAMKTIAAKQLRSGMARCRPP
jgi:hypothetical protein